MTGLPEDRISSTYHSSTLWACRSAYPADSPGLSGPVEALNRQKVPRPAGFVLVVLVVLGALGLGGTCCCPRWRSRRRRSWFLPSALSQVVEQVREIARGMVGELG